MRNSPPPAPESTPWTHWCRPNLFRTIPQNQWVNENKWHLMQAKQTEVAIHKKLYFWNFQNWLWVGRHFLHCQRNWKTCHKLNFQLGLNFQKRTGLRISYCQLWLQQMVHSKSCFFRKPAEKSKKIGAQKIRGRLSLVFLILKRLRLHLSHFFQTSL